MLTLSFAKAALERALRAAAWSLSSLLIADGTDLLNTDWPNRLSVAGMAGLLSLLASFAGSMVGGTGPSLANEAIVPPAKDPGTPKDTYLGPRDYGYGLIELCVAVLVIVVLVLLIFRLA